MTDSPPLTAPADVSVGRAERENRAAALAGALRGAGLDGLEGTEGTLLGLEVGQDGFEVGELALESRALLGQELVEGVDAVLEALGLLVEGFAFLGDDAADGVDQAGEAAFHQPADPEALDRGRGGCACGDRLGVAEEFLNGLG